MRGDIARRLLARPSAYRAVQRLVRGDAYRLFVGQYVRPQAGQKVLDIGCGPADIVEHMAGVSYVGIDPCQAYIRAARERYGNRAEFVCSELSRVTLEPESFDVAIAYGVLHHLDDASVAELYDFAHRALKRRGRLITLDGCFVDDQRPAARFLLGRDRGEHVRRADQYLALVPQRFEVRRADVCHDVLRIPYTMLIVEAAKRV